MCDDGRLPVLESRLSRLEDERLALMAERNGLRVQVQWLQDQLDVARRIIDATEDLREREGL